MAVSRIELSEDSLEVSRIIAGVMRVETWGLNAAQLGDWIKACIDLGITTFDNADVYGKGFYSAETRFGEAMTGKSYLRQQIQLVTKCGIKMLSSRRPEHRLHSYDTSKAHILQSVETSLKDLRTDYVDLLLIHRPDPLMNADEIAEAMLELWESGKVLYFGVSNFSNPQFSLIDSRLSEFDLITNQIELSPYHLDPLHDGTLDFLQMLGIVPMIWSPVARGRVFTDTDERALRIQAVLKQIGEEVNASMDQVLLAWILMLPSNPVPVLGTGNLERIKSAAAAEKIELTREHWFMIWEASTGHEVP